MTLMFLTGAFATATCSWLLAVAVIFVAVIKRPLTPIEMVLAFVSGIGFAVVVLIILRRKIRRANRNSVSL